MRGKVVLWCVVLVFLTMDTHFSAVSAAYTPQVGDEQAPARVRLAQAASKQVDATPSTPPHNAPDNSSSNNNNNDKPRTLHELVARLVLATRDRLAKSAAGPSPPDLALGANATDVGAMVAAARNGTDGAELQETARNLTLALAAVMGKESLTVVNWTYRVATAVVLFSLAGVAVHVLAHLDDFVISRLKFPTVMLAVITIIIALTLGGLGLGFVYTAQDALAMCGSALFALLSVAAFVFSEVLPHSESTRVVVQAISYLLEMLSVLTLGLGLSSLGTGRFMSGSLMVVLGIARVVAAFKAAQSDSYRRPIVIEAVVAVVVKIVLACLGMIGVIPMHSGKQVVMMGLGSAAGDMVMHMITGATFSGRLKAEINKNPSEKNLLAHYRRQYQRLVFASVASALVLGGIVTFLVFALLNGEDEAKFKKSMGPWLYAIMYQMVLVAISVFSFAPVFRKAEVDRRLPSDIAHRMYIARKHCTCDAGVTEFQDEKCKALFEGCKVPLEEKMDDSESDGEQDPSRFDPRTPDTIHREICGDGSGEPSLSDLQNNVVACAWTSHTSSADSRQYAYNALSLAERVALLFMSIDYSSLVAAPEQTTETVAPTTILLVVVLVLFGCLEVLLGSRSKYTQLVSDTFLATSLTRVNQWLELFAIGAPVVLSAVGEGREKVLGDAAWIPRKGIPYFVYVIVLCVAIVPSLARVVSELLRSYHALQVLTTPMNFGKGTMPARAFADEWARTVAASTASIADVQALDPDVACSSTWQFMNDATRTGILTEFNTKFTALDADVVQRGVQKYKESDLFDEDMQGVLRKGSVGGWFDEAVAKARAYLADPNTPPHTKLKETYQLEDMRPLRQMEILFRHFFLEAMKTQVTQISACLGMYDSAALATPVGVLYSQVLATYPDFRHDALRTRARAFWEVDHVTSEATASRVYGAVPHGLVQYAYTCHNPKPMLGAHSIANPDVTITDPFPRRTTDTLSYAQRVWCAIVELEIAAVYVQAIELPGDEGNEKKARLRDMMDSASRLLTFDAAIALQYTDAEAQHEHDATHANKPDAPPHQPQQSLALEDMENAASQREDFMYGLQLITTEGNKLFHWFYDSLCKMDVPSSDTKTTIQRRIDSMASSKHGVNIENQRVQDLVEGRDPAPGYHHHCNARQFVRQRIGPTLSLTTWFKNLRFQLEQPLLHGAMGLVKLLFVIGFADSASSLHLAATSTESSTSTPRWMRVMGVVVPLVLFTIDSNILNTIRASADELKQRGLDPAGLRKELAADKLLTNLATIQVGLDLLLLGLNAMSYNSGSYELKCWILAVAVVRGTMFLLLLTSTRASLARPAVDPPTFGEVFLAYFSPDHLQWSRNYDPTDLKSSLSRAPLPDFARITSVVLGLFLMVVQILAVTGTSARATSLQQVAESEGHHDAAAEHAEGAKDSPNTNTNGGGNSKEEGA